MIDRRGIIQDLQAMAERASREARRHIGNAPTWERAITFYLECRDFARELEGRETGSGS